MTRYVEGEERSSRRYCHACGDLWSMTAPYPVVWCALNGMAGELHTGDAPSFWPGWRLAASPRRSVVACDGKFAWASYDRMAPTIARRLKRRSKSHWLRRWF